MSVSYIPDKEEYKNITPFKRYVLQNFPYIDATFDAMTNYELLGKVIEKLNEVISNQNITNDNVNNLYNAMIQFQNYINNYFDNLDVQDEINNKLDEMVADGTLTELIGNYVDPRLDSFENNINQTISNQNDIINSQNQLINALDVKVSNAVSGSPLVADSVAGMVDTTRTYVNTTNGKWYYYDGDSWEIGGDYQSTGIGENTIDYKMLNNRLKDTYEPNENLIYTVDKIAGTYLNIETGATFETSAFGTTDFIPVKPSTRYYVTFKASVNNLGSIRYLEYGSNKDYLNIYHLGNSSVEYITTDASTHYIRVSASNVAYTNSLILCENPLVYCENTNALMLDGKNILNNSVNGKVIIDNTLSLNSLEEYIVTSNNIYNPNNAILSNHMINSNTGLVSPISGFSVTDFQKIKPNTEYSTNYVRGIFIYDINKNYITYTANATSVPITITTPANACYYRFYTETGNLNKIKIGEGTTAPTDDYSYIIRGINTNQAIETNNIANLLYDKDETVNIKLLGDSITYGVGASNRLTKSWAGLLENELESKFNCSVVNNAVSGTNSAYIVANLSTLISDTDNIVICMIGTNNRITEGSFNSLYNDLQTIYEYCQERNIKFIPMCSLPASIMDEEREDGSFSVRYAHMEDISHVISAFAQKNNMEYIDLFHDVYNYCFTSGNSLDLLLSDGLHPNDSGYYVMYRYIMHGLGLDAKIQGATW